MLIEIAGVDGSGKSTLIDLLMGWAHRAAVPSYEWVLRSSFRRVVTALDSGTIPRLADRVAGDPLEFAVCMELIKEVSSIPTVTSTHQLIFVDTYVHSWLANAQQEGSSLVSTIAALYRVLPAPDLSFELEIDPEVAYARVRQRPKLDQALAAGDSNYFTARTAALTATRATCGYRIETLDGMLPPGELASTIRRRIARAAGVPLRRFCSSDQLPREPGLP